jgi:hypothetical protein
MKNKFAYLFITFVMFITFLSNDLASQQLTTPVIVHFPIMLKSLEYDRNLMNKNNGVIRIGIVYQEQFRPSLNAKNQLLRYIADNNIKNLAKYKLEIIPINLIDISEFSDFVKNNDIDVTYITPLRAVNIDKLAQIHKSNSILSLTGVVEYIDNKIPFSVDVVGDNPKIVIDLTNSRLSGADFSTNLLKLAKVINLNETE